MACRQYTNLLLEQIEEGLHDKDTIIKMCLMWMSESDVEEMLRANDLIEEEEEDDD
jgi:hypothetical protein